MSKTKEELEFSLSYPCPGECRDGEKGCTFAARVSWTESVNAGKTICADIVLELLKPQGSDKCKPGEWFLRLGKTNCEFEGPPNKMLLLSDGAVQRPVAGPIKELCDVEYWDDNFAPDATKGKPYKIRVHGWDVDRYHIRLALDCECLCKEGQGSWTRSLKIDSALRSS
jgi:hypothetical protein